MDSAAARRQWRRDFVDKFLAEIGLTYDVLAQSTQKNLDDWARQVQLITDQPSANWDQAVMQLSKAVESELACTLGPIKGLAFLASDETLGTKANRLKDFQWQTATKRLSLLGFTLPSTALPGLLSSLARLRNDSAHGGVAGRTAGKREGQQARNLTAKILKEIVSAGKGQS